MKHAGAEALTELESLLVELRGFTELNEKKHGVFYRKSRAFLHFHEDPQGLFADVRLNGPEFTRMRVSTKAERKQLVRALRSVVAE